MKRLIFVYLTLSLLIAHLSIQISDNLSVNGKIKYLLDNTSQRGYHYNATWLPVDLTIVFKNTSNIKFQYGSNNDSLFEYLYNTYLAHENNSFYLDEDGKVPTNGYLPVIPFYGHEKYFFKGNYTGGLYLLYDESIIFTIDSSNNLNSMNVNGVKRDVEVWTIKIDNLTTTNYVHQVIYDTTIKFAKTSGLLLYFEVHLKRYTQYSEQLIENFVLNTKVQALESTNLNFVLNSTPMSIFSNLFIVLFFLIPIVR